MVTLRVLWGPARPQLTEFKRKTATRDTRMAVIRWTFSCARFTALRVEDRTSTRSAATYDGSAQVQSSLSVRTPQQPPAPALHSVGGEGEEHPHGPL